MASEFEKILARLDKEKTTGAFEHAADELINFITDDSTVGRVSDTFRKSESVWVRYGILKAYEMMNHAGSTAYRTLSQHCREVILEDLLVGLADKDKGIRMTSSDILSNGEELMKGAKPELGERIVKGLIENSERARESSVVEALGVADYSGISEETKKRATDFLVKAALEGSRNAARGVDRIGGEASKDIIRQHWLPKLDSRREKDVENALEIFSKLECKAAADKVDELVKKGNGDSYYNLVDVLVKSGDERHEDSMLKLMKNERGYCIADMEILGKKGWRKSLEILNGVLKNTKDYDEQDREAAKKAIKEIDGRMTVSSKPAEKKLEEAMKRKKVPA